MILKDEILDREPDRGRRVSGTAAWRSARRLPRRRSGISASAELADADLGAGFADFGWPGLSGNGGARFAVETSGASPAAAVAPLSGSASLNIAQGAIAGVNLEEALRRSQRRPIDVARDMRLGGTAFHRLAVELALEEGRRPSRQRRDGLRRGRGDARGRDQSCRAKLGFARPGDADRLTGAESQNAARLTIDVGGPWSSPSVEARGDRDRVRDQRDRRSRFRPEGSRRAGADGPIVGLPAKSGTPAKKITIR